jgi:nucleolar protein 15
MPSVTRKQSKKAALMVESEDEIEESVLNEFKAEFGCEEVEEVLSDDAAVSDEEEEEDDGVKISFQDESGSEAESVSEAEAETVEPKEVQPLKLDAKTEEKMSRKMKKAAAAARVGEVKGVVYLARIPHGLSLLYSHHPGFYEAQITSYFRQFGQVSRVRLSRNKKTGASKHYGYIEFRSREVAQIVADTMNGYLIYSHILKCEVMENVRKDLFKGSGRKYMPLKWNQREAERHNKPKTAEQVEKREDRMKSTQRRKSKALKAMGIDFDFPVAKRVKISAASVEKEE